MDPADEPLRQVLRAEAYRVPVRLEPSALRDRLAADEQRRRGAWITAGAPAALLAAAAGVVVLLGSLTPGPPDDAGASRTTVPTTACPESEATRHGSWWVEIGGPNAYFNVAPGSLTAGPYPWLLIVRFDPDSGAGEAVSTFAEHLESGERVDGRFNSPMDPANIYRRDVPAESLPGGWYLFEQPLPTTGCWRLSAAIEGRVVGSAVIDVRFVQPPPPTDTVAPTPQIAPESELLNRALAACPEPPATLSPEAINCADAMRIAVAEIERSLPVPVASITFRLGMYCEAGLECPFTPFRATVSFEFETASGTRRGWIELVRDDDGNLRATGPLRFEPGPTPLGR